MGTLHEGQTHLVAKNTSCPGTCAVAFIGAGFYDMFYKFQVLLHGCKVSEKLKVES